MVDDPPRPLGSRDPSDPQDPSQSTGARRVPWDPKKFPGTAGINKFFIFKKLQFFNYKNFSGLVKLGFLVNKSPCSTKQVQENVVRLVILCSY